MIQDRKTTTAAQESSPKPGRRKSAGPKARYADLFNRAPAGYCTLDADGRILEANPALSSLLGAPPAALLRESFSQFVFPEDQAIFDRLRQELAGSGDFQACELRLEKKNGTVLWAHLAAILVPEAGGAPTCRIAASDISPFVQMERSLRRLYVVLAQINQALVHFQKRDELLREICRIAVGFGGFRMAWIGLVDPATRQLKPIAHDGHEEGFLKSIHVNVNPDSAFSQGPIGQAFLRNQVVASNESDPSFQRSPWRNEMLKRGYRALAAVPFRLNNEAIGTLNLYLDAPRAFSEEERDVLKRIGGTLSFALDCLEIEKSRQRAEAALRESEAQNRAFIHAIPDLVFMNKRDGEYLAVHAPDPGLLAAPPDAVLHRKIGELLPKSIADRCLHAIAAALDSRTLQKLTYVLPLDGRKRRFEARIAPCTPDTVLTIVRDITELQPIGKAARGKKTRRPNAPA
ncbi:MAG: GAF domain-containing protein [Kiritimatiellia bacterium]